jgi:hypothetical protein
MIGINHGFSLCCFKKMTTNTFKVTVHLVSSLDGCIAKKDNSVSWFETPDQYEKGRNPCNQEHDTKQE